MTIHGPKIAHLSQAEQPIATFSVDILGPFIVTRDGVELDTARWQHAATNLLQMLVTDPHHRRLKEDVVTALWPDATTQSAASNLRYILHILRRHLNGGNPYPVVVDHGWMSLNAAYHWRIDLERFEGLLVDPRDHERLLLAASLYRGEPLIEVRHEDWAMQVRNRIRREWRELCLRLARLYHDGGNPDAALQSLDRVLEQDPLDEEALRDALQTLSDAGRIYEALRRYQQYVAQLRAEMGVPPSEDLRVLVSRLQTSERNTRKSEQCAIQSAALIPSYPLPTDVPLASRRKELQQLLDALADCQSSGSRLVLLKGETGVGKSRLLAEVAVHARARNMLTLASACYEQEGRLPYGPFHDALLDYVRAVPRAALDTSISDLLPEIARIVPELHDHGNASPQPRYSERADERLHLYAAVAQVLERVAGQHGIVFLLDDLQWADRASIHLLHYLLRQPHLTRTLFVGTYRDDEPTASDSFADLLAEAHLNLGVSQYIKIIALEPLDQNAIGTLTCSWLGMAGSDELVSDVWHASAGNPLYAMQILALLHEHGSLEQANNQWRMRGGSENVLPSSMREIVIKRLERLASAQVKVLRIGAVLGRGFTHQALVDIWGSDDDALYDALDALLDLKLLRESGEGYVFAQPVIREVIYGQMPRFHRRHVHARAAHALEAIYAERASQHAAELADHLQQAAVWDRARFYLRIAGERAEEAYAHDEAIHHYRAALDLTARTEPDPGADAELRIQLGKLLRVTGRIEEAESELCQAAEVSASVGEPVLQAAAWVGLSKTYMRATNRDRMAAALARVESLRPALVTSAPSRQLFLLYLELSTVYCSCAEYQETLTAREQALAIAEGLHDEQLVVRAESARSVALGMLGHTREAGELAQQLIPRAEASGDIEALRLSLAQAAEWAMLAGAFADSRAFRQRELAAAKRMGATSITPFVQSNIAQLSLHMGAWDDATSDLEQALSAFLANGDRFRVTYPLAYLGELALRRGAREEGIRLLDECSDIAKQANDLQVLRYAQRLLAEEDVLAGQPQKAVDRLQPLLDRPGHEEHVVPLILATLAWAHLALHDDACGASDLAASMARAMAEGNHIALQETLRVRGLLHTYQSRHAEADADFRESIRLARQMPYPFAEARTLVGYAALLRGNGRLSHARAALEQAHAIFQRLRATKDIHGTACALADLI